MISGKRSHTVTSVQITSVRERAGWRCLNPALSSTRVIFRADLSLFHQNHLLGDRCAPRIESVEIYSAGQPGSVKNHLVIAGVCHA